MRSDTPGQVVTRTQFFLLEQEKMSAIVRVSASGAPSIDGADRRQYGVFVGRLFHQQSRLSKWGYHGTELRVDTDKFRKTTHPTVCTTNPINLTREENLVAPRAKKQAFSDANVADTRILTQRIMYRVDDQPLMVGVKRFSVEPVSAVSPGEPVICDDATLAKAVRPVKSEWVVRGSDGEVWQCASVLPCARLRIVYRDNTERIVHSLPTQTIGERRDIDEMKEGDEERDPAVILRARSNVDGAKLLFPNIKPFGEDTVFRDNGQCFANKTTRQAGSACMEISFMPVVGRNVPFVNLVRPGFIFDVKTIDRQNFVVRADEDDQRLVVLHGMELPVATHFDRPRAAVFAQPPTEATEGTKTIKLCDVIAMRGPRVTALGNGCDDRASWKRAFHAQQAAARGGAAFTPKDVGKVLHVEASKASAAVQIRLVDQKTGTSEIRHVKWIDEPALEKLPHVDIDFGGPIIAVDGQAVIVRSKLNGASVTLMCVRVHLDDIFVFDRARLGDGVDVSKLVRETTRIDAVPPSHMVQALAVAAHHAARKDVALAINQYDCPNPHFLALPLLDGSVEYRCNARLHPDPAVCAYARGHDAPRRVCAMRLPVLNQNGHVCWGDGRQRDAGFSVKDDFEIVERKAYTASCSDTRTFSDDNDATMFGHRHEVDGLLTLQLWLQGSQFIVCANPHCSFRREQNYGTPDGLLFKMLAYVDTDNKLRATEADAFSFKLLEEINAAHADVSVDAHGKLDRTLTMLHPWTVLKFQDEKYYRIMWRCVATIEAKSHLGGARLNAKPFEEQAICQRRVVFGVDDTESYIVSWSFRGANVFHISAKEMQSEFLATVSVVVSDAQIDVDRGKSPEFSESKTTVRVTRGLSTKNYAKFVLGPDDVPFRTFLPVTELACGEFRFFVYEDSHVVVAAPRPWSSPPDKDMSTAHAYTNLLLAARAAGVDRNDMKVVPPSDETFSMPHWRALSSTNSSNTYYLQCDVEDHLAQIPTVIQEATYDESAWSKWWNELMILLANRRQSAVLSLDGVLSKKSECVDASVDAVVMFQQLLDDTAQDADDNTTQTWCRVDNATSLIAEDYILKQVREMLTRAWVDERATELVLYKPAFKRRVDTDITVEIEHAVTGASARFKLFARPPVAPTDRRILRQLFSNVPRPTFQDPRLEDRVRHRLHTR